MACIPASPSSDFALRHDTPRLDEQVQLIVMGTGTWVWVPVFFCHICNNVVGCFCVVT